MSQIKVWIIIFLCKRAQRSEVWTNQGTHGLPYCMDAEDDAVHTMTAVYVPLPVWAVGVVPAGEGHVLFIFVWWWDSVGLHWRSKAWQCYSSLFCHHRLHVQPVHPIFISRGQWPYLCLLGGEGDCTFCFSLILVSQCHSEKKHRYILYWKYLFFLFLFFYIMFLNEFLKIFVFCKLNWKIYSEIWS